MNEDIYFRKQVFRKNIRELKKLVSSEEKLKKSHLIFSDLEKRQYFSDAKNILCYWSMPDEVQTIEFIIRNMHLKQFFLPVVRGEYLEIRQFEGTEKMTSGEAFNISEPIGKILDDLSSIDLIIVPGIAFDKKMNRLGRGKAYYDTLLPNMKGFKLGVCFDFQYFDEIPATCLDIKMDEVIVA